MFINTSTLLLMALALSMDAMAVSISRALSCPVNKLDWLHCGVFFGVAQGIMPLAGYFAAEKIAGNLIKSGGNLIAAGVLGFIGIKMLLDAKENADCTISYHQNYFGLLFVQSIATSIDAMAIGVGMFATNQNIFTAASVIALITFFVCIFSHLIASSFNVSGSQKAQFAAGCILIGIALKSLLF